MRVKFPGPVKPLSPSEYAAVKQWVKDFQAHAEKIRATLKKESK